MLYELHQSYLVEGMVAMPAGLNLGLAVTVVETSLVSELQSDNEHAQHDVSPTDKYLLS